MSAESIPLQHDMFSGELVDTRTAKQKKEDNERNDWKQMAMFKLREIIQPDVRIRPIINISRLSPGKLVLVSEDIRTEEEKEAARRKQAERLTLKMFELEREVNGSSETPAVAPQVNPDTSATATNSLPTTAKKTHNPKLTAYLELVQVVHEQVTTVWVAEDYRQRFLSQVPLVVLNASAAGLTSSEMTAALQAGQFLNWSDTPSPETVSANGHIAPSERVVIPITAPVKSNAVIYEAAGGYRRYARHAGVRLRARRKTPQPVSKHESRPIYA